MERKELHRQIELLSRKLKNGELKISSHLVNSFENSMKKIKYDNNGMIDPNSVDSRIRSTLHAVTYFDDRQNVKQQVSLTEIQQLYFKGIEQAFGEAYRLMKEGKSDPITFASWYTSDENRVNQISDNLEQFLSNNMEFWRNVSEPAQIHLEDSTTTKAVFAGEIFPSGDTTITNSTGIYFDTTILPDPFLRLFPLAQVMDKRKLCYEILKTGLSTMQYKKLALVELPRPIVAILPDRHILEESYREFIDHFSYQDTLTHARSLFGHNFEDIDELKNYLYQFTDPKSIVSEMRNPNGLLFDTEWDEELPDQIERYMKNHLGKDSIGNAGEAVFIHLYSRFSQANDAYQRSKELSGIPIIKAETSWYWYNRMLNINSKKINDYKNKSLHIARALQTGLDKKISWISNVPTDALIEIRKTGALEEIRELLSNGISDLTKLKPNNFFETSDTVINNLQKAFTEHEQGIRELKSKKWKFAGKDLGSFIGVGGIEIAAAITGVPLFGALAAGAGMSGYVPTIKELKEKLDNIRSEQKKYENSGLGILLKHKK